MKTTKKTEKTVELKDYVPLTYNLSQKEKG